MAYAATGTVDANITKPIHGIVWACENSTDTRSRGIFYEDNPFSYTLPVLFIQTSLVSLLTTFLQFLLTPLGESSFFSQMLAGLILGPSVIGQSEFLSKWLFPLKTFYISETIGFFGIMIFMFLVGVKIDISIVKRTGRKAWVIGICSFIVPLIFSMLIAFVLRTTLHPEHNLYNSMGYIAFFLSTTSFHVTALHLADLKLLNSDMGRLAVSASMIGGSISLFWVTAATTEKQTRHRKDNSYHFMSICMIGLIVFIVCALRPIMLWMVRNTPQGKPIKEAYILSVFLMLLGCALVCEIIGEHFMIGPIIFGMAVPDGPPLGSALAERLETLVSDVFMPLYYLYSGARFKVFLIEARSFALVQVIAMFGFVGKIIGIMVPSIYWKMPVTDSLSLGLLMASHGVTQLLYLQTALHLRILDDQAYGNVLIAILWVTGATTPVVKFLYDPSKRYLSLNRKRTIENTPTNIELCIMTCIHYQDNTPTIINLLEISNPTLESPICFYVLHLIELKGRSTPLFIDHQPDNKMHTSHSHDSQHIINAFRSYEQQKSGNLLVKLYTSISPYETMHDEICTQVVDKRACLLIVPFHIQWRPTGVTESSPPIRALNRHLLRTAPCSVGILIERGALSKNNPLTIASYYSVGIVFIDGSDDREALAYAMRMAGHPGVRITLIRLMEPRKKNKNFINRDPDGDLIHKFKVDCIQIKRHDYREEIVRDCVEMINVIRSLEGCFDLILVGRRHENQSSLFSGLTEWNEYPELGPIGDMLVASDSTFDGSVLVIQQQKRSGASHQDLHVESVINKQETLTIVEVPRDRKVWQNV